jgi:hypothetical protein
MIIGLAGPKRPAAGLARKGCSGSLRSRRVIAGRTELPVLSSLGGAFAPQLVREPTITRIWFAEPTITRNWLAGALDFHGTECS